MPPVSEIATCRSSLPCAKCVMAVSEFSFALVLESPSSSASSGLIPPASTMLTRFPAESLARLASAAAACSLPES